MDVDKFWQMIDDARQATNGDLEAERLWLIDTLAQASVDDIKRFEYIYQTMMNEAYRADLWDACYLINCGCGEDGFKDFRAWVIAHGRNTFYAALDDPETLVALVHSEDRLETIFDFEEFSYIAYEAYKQKTGEELEDYSLPEFSPLIGELLHDEEIIKQRFPKLYEKLGDCV